ncbi:structural protein VP3 [Sulfolobus polyhedral virus 1]|uniref:Structural protein VP3 n=2 Tax=Alphaportoglobovirus TaxID=2169647 RepID=A0A1W6I189_SPV1|nr:structural protein VP3 [Sulfolobus polyhedral virus 1]YP_010084295.1 putative viral structural protein [Sulfolobus polyhedral virus 2]ARM37826.1 structural protein VP3 [Sulfolobus polyhedral virus 1]AZI76044.1 putative viral structural protein [Sulfolobus polyhedral virus 2]
MADIKMALLKGVGSALAGYIGSYVKSYIVTPIQSKLPTSAQPYAGVIVGSLVGALLFYFLSDKSDYADALIGGLVGAIADPPIVLPNAPAGQRINLAQGVSAYMGSIPTQTVARPPIVS